MRRVMVKKVRAKAGKGRVRLRRVIRARRARKMRQRRGKRGWA